MRPTEDTERVNMGERVALAEAIQEVMRGQARAGLDQWRGQELEAAIMRRMADVERRLEALGGIVDTTAVVALLEHVARVWSRAADPAKRRLVENLFVNAFDGKHYQAGMTQTLLDVLDHLTYADLWHLHKWRAQTRSFCRFFPWRDSTDMAFYHAERLRHWRLVVKEHYGKEDEDAKVLPTALGKLLLDLVDPVEAPK